LLAGGQAQVPVRDPGLEVLDQVVPALREQGQRARGRVRRLRGQRLEALTKRTTNATTGTLTLLAQGRETLVNDFKSRIADWDLRLATRKETLTRQFTAMETALSSLKNQSSWLAGQLGSLSG
ncbi:MAG TPA: flagellar filament capping protein FliD, partial [Geodermatophilus sp.]|nr:flagellar filament capping protein FliD [Geodermatophilus sp.]